MSLLYVGIGGALGSITRYMLGKLMGKWCKSAFPLGTFTINITGAFLLGLISSLNVNQTLYLLIADGFLGAYTTFSTFMYEGFNLFEGSKKKNALTYILGTLILGILGYSAGYKIGL